MPFYTKKTFNWNDETESDWRRRRGSDNSSSNNSNMRSSNGDYNSYTPSPEKILLKKLHDAIVEDDLDEVKKLLPGVKYRDREYW